MKRLNRPRRGQGMTEYIIIVAMVAIAAIGVITVFGEQIRKAFGNIGDAITGSTSMTYTYQAAGSKATAKKTLGTFVSDSDGND